MRRSDAIRTKAAQTLARIEALLEDMGAVAAAGVAIDQALQAMRIPERATPTAAHLHHVLGDFLGLVEQGFGAPSPVLPPWCRKDTAFALLAQAYRGVQDVGHDGALWDMGHPMDPLLPDGRDEVVMQVAAIMKARLSQLYSNWVYQHCIDPHDHALRLALVAVIQQRYGPSLTDDIRTADPLELADSIPTLLQAILETTQQARHFWATDLA